MLTIPSSTSMFSRFDKDGNGTLDRKEAYQAQLIGCIWAEEGQTIETFKNAAKTCIIRNAKKAAKQHGETTTHTEKSGLIGSTEKTFNTKLTEANS